MHTFPAAAVAVKSCAPTSSLLPPTLIAPGVVRASFRPFASPLPPLVPTTAEVALADRLAWEQDGGDPDDYRPGWADRDPSEVDAYLAERHGADHDAQPDPYAIEVWAESAADRRWRLATEQYELDQMEAERLADLEHANMEAGGWWHRACRLD